jgi:hypothetical protein
MKNFMTKNNLHGIQRFISYRKENSKVRVNLKERSVTAVYENNSCLVFESNEARYV